MRDAGDAVGHGASAIRPISTSGGQVLAQQSVVFFDSEAFDTNLADAMKDRAEAVHVKFAGPTSLNSIPPRMNTWLAEVKHSDGQVTTVDPKAPRAGSVSAWSLT